jgi:esterase
MLHTESFGHGPDVVFLHGLFGAGDNWRSVGKQLSDHYRIHLIDLPNHGKSEWLDNPDLPILANLLDQWLTSNKIERFTLLGHSMGGKVAMQFSLNPHAGVLEKLIIVDIAPKRYAPHHQDVFEALNRVVFTPEMDRKSVEQELAPYVTDNSIRQFLLKSLHKQGDRLAWRFNVKVLEEKYDAVACEPTKTESFIGSALFIKGMNSQYIQPEDQPTILSMFPNAKAKLIEGAGHWPHAEKPTAFVKIIKDFLKDT